MLSLPNKLIDIFQILNQEILMYISGMSVEKRLTEKKKKIKKNNSLSKRPCSSQFPDIFQYTKKPIPQQEKFHKKSSSINRSQLGSKVKLQKIQNIQNVLTKQHNNNKLFYTDQLISQPHKQIKSQKHSENFQIIKKLSTQKIKYNAQEYNKNNYDQIKLINFFRYYPITFISICGKKQELFKSLEDKSNFKTLSAYTKLNKLKQIQDILNKLIKFANLKSKYRYRQKFNFIYSSQLKALKYKRKEHKKKKQSSSSQSESQETKQKIRDIDTWKKAKGIQGKVFIVRGKYPALRNALIDRGWVENQDRNSTFFDFKWTTKVNHINFDTLKPNQVVNHFNNNACLTSKYGICKSLRSILFNQGVNTDKFFPKAFDLGDLTDFQNFLQVYKWTFCQSMLKKYKVENFKKLNYEQLLRLKISIMVTERRLSMRNLQFTINNTLANKYYLCSINEWNCLSNLPYDEQDIFQSLVRYHLQKQVNNIQQRIKHTLEQLSIIEPQYHLNGHDNIWIAKPAFLSRGRGIKCIADFNSILDYTLGKDTQYVVQKYIENPLLINNRKFDIRQWVLIQDYNPPKIWFYMEFYLRFCMEEYNVKKLNNKYAHLTNDSIQKNKYKKDLKIQQGQNEEDKILSRMWSSEQFKEFVIEKQGNNQQKNKHYSKIISKMKEIVVSTILATQDQVYGRKNTFQIVGYDFMIDTDYNPWLIQINTSPAMDYSTPVTKRLVQMMLDDSVKVIFDDKNKSKKKKNYGLYKCIYKGEQYKFKNYKIDQSS